MASTVQNPLILNAAVLGLGLHMGAWRYREGDPFDYTKIEFYQEIGRIAEAGCLQAVFLADTLAVAEENFERPNFGAMDPTIVLAAVASVTEHVGLVATASTTYNEPYNLARRISTLDHLSRGRASWNIVTTFIPDVAANFGTAELPNHDDRYERAEEFVDIVTRLWDSWEDDALIGDKTTGRFADATRVHAINHRGAHYTVRGPITLPRSPQGRPVLYQSGSSGPGRDLAARFADAVFTPQNTIAAAQEFRADVRRRTKERGRSPDDIKIIPGFLPVLGGTEAEARARKDRLDELGGHAELKKLALRVGLRVEDLKLDEPLPIKLIEENDHFRASEGFRDAVVRLAVEEKLTVREILYRNGGGHVQVVGTPEQVADVIATWHREGAVDGFNLMIDALPDGLRDFVEQVIPILQRRGAFRREYVGTTLRSNLGLASRH
ncbi:MAG: LLM class flavin-dependent oxidoreductase [Bradyrhizobiaceae bacterium]|nr:LLM class flavin-dependent oxidoreductase [Bradyrhizobiaceae bacterium]